MKIKLNKEQVTYLNGLEDTETKKQFLLDCFIDQCETSLCIEGPDIEEHIVINNPESGTYIHKNKGSITFTFDKSIGDREKFDKFIEDNGLKKFTPKTKNNYDLIPSPIVTGNIFMYSGRDEDDEKFIKDIESASKFFNVELIGELLDYKPPHPDDLKKYSKKDLNNAFESARNSWHLKDFEDYLKTLK